MSEHADEQKTTLFDDGDEDRFLLTSKFAINNVLLDLGKRPEIITAYFNHGKEYILTAVLGVMPDRDLLVLDYGAVESQNRRLLEYGRATCVTRHESISIKFSCEILQTARFQGRQAFAARLPETLYRKQQREFFRVALPRINPYRCHLDVPGYGSFSLNVCDISVGGLSLIEPDLKFDPEIGTLLPGCRAELGDNETFTVDLKVRNTLLITQNDGKQVRRIGCSFEGLLVDKSAQIQRLIHKIQLEQKAKDSD